MNKNDNCYHQNDRSRYEAPLLKEWGAVSDLTQVGKTNPGGDMHGGSVNPPGHENNPGLGNGNRGGPGNRPF